MNAPTFNLQLHPRLIFSEPAKVTNKLQRFAMAGADSLYFLFDYDCTLTTSKHTGVDMTTWQIMHGLLPKEGRVRDKAIRIKYLALESAGLLSPQDSHTWTISQLKLHAEHGTHMHEIERAAKEVKLRDGARELFDVCERLKMPTVILSAGIGDVIKIILREHGITPTILLSVKLLFDKQDRIVGYDPATVVLTHNKRDKVERDLAGVREGRPFTILVGDTIEDAKMVKGADDVLRIRVCDLKKDEHSARSAYLKQSFNAGYDIIVEEDLWPLVSLTGWLSGVPQPQTN